MAVIPTNDTARQIRRFLNSSSTAGDTSLPFTVGNRQVAMVEVGEKVGDYYECTAKDYSPITKTWTSYPDSICFSANSTDLRTGKTYKGLNCGPGADGKPVFVLDAGSGRWKWRDEWDLNLLTGLYPGDGCSFEAEYTDLTNDLIEIDCGCGPCAETVSFPCFPRLKPATYLLNWHYISGEIHELHNHQDTLTYLTGHPVYGIHYRGPYNIKDWTRPGIFPGTTYNYTQGYGYFTLACPLVSSPWLIFSCQNVCYTWTGMSNVAVSSFYFYEEHSTTDLLKVPISLLANNCCFSVRTKLRWPSSNLTSWWDTVYELEFVPS